MHDLHASFTFGAGILSIAIPWEHIRILNARLGGETDQQNVIMHKGY